MSGSSALLQPRRRRARGSGRTTLPGLRVVVGHPESQVCSFLGRRLTLGSQTAALLHPQPAPRERLSCALWLRCSVVSDAATPWTAAPRLLCPWDPPGKDTGVGCRFLLQGLSLCEALGCPSLSLPLPFCNPEIWLLLENTV